MEESPVGHKVVGASAMVRSLCELEWEKGERRGRGSLGKEACGRRAYKKRKEREGVRYRNEGENREPTSMPGKEGCTEEEDEASTAPCPGHASVAHAGPATDGVRRARGDSNPTCMHDPTDHRDDVKSGVLITPDHQRAKFSLSLFSFFNNHVNSVTLEEHNTRTHCGFPVRTPEYFYKGECL
jgi:hypothetical protein